MTPSASFLMTTGTTLVASLAFVLSGMWFLSKFNFERSKSSTFQVAGAFFIGGSLFLISYRTISQFSEGLRVPVTVAFGILLIFAAAGVPAFKKAIADSSGGWKFVAGSLAVAALVEALLLTYWLPTPWAPRDAPFEFIGSLHSGRYVALAEYIVEHNHIPVLGQNYGQALLTSISLLAGAHSPYLALHLWLVTHVCALILLVFGFFRMKHRDLSVAITAAVVTALGGSALSLSNFTVIDSGNPWLLSGYSDSIAGLATFLVFLILCLSVKKHDLWFLAWGSVILGIFTLRWGMSSPQNILLMLALLSAAFLLRALRQKGWRFSIIVVFGIVLCAFTAGVRRQGGMLSPRTIQEDIKLVGILNVEQDPAQGKRVMIVPYLRHFLVGSSDEFKLVESPDKGSAQKFRQLLERKWNDIDVWPAIFAMCEEYFLAAFRALFWPIAGTIVALSIGIREHRRTTNRGNVAACESHTRTPAGEPNGPPSYLFALSMVNMVVLGAGLGACFLFEVNGFKWELTRFMIPGYAIGMLLVVGSAAHLIANNADESRVKTWLAALVAILCFGPTTFLAYNCLKNMVSQSGGLSFVRRIERLITRTGPGFSKGEYSTNIQGILSNAVQVASQRISFGGTFTPFALVLRGTALSVEETNVTLDAAKQTEALFQKLEDLRRSSNFNGVAVVEMVQENTAAPDDFAFVVTIEHLDADPSTYKIPFKRRQKNHELGGISRMDAPQRLLPWQ